MLLRHLTTIDLVKNAAHPFGQALRQIPEWVSWRECNSLPANAHMNDKFPETSREKQKLLFRVRRLRGQFAAVERALTAGDECADILMLLAAIRGGVNGLMAEILEDHIRLHMMNPDQKLDSPEELGEDLIGLVRAYLK